MKVSYLNDQFFSRLETLALNLKTDLAGYFGGSTSSRLTDRQWSFSDYREYQLGDDIRRIDWNLYSRFEKYFLNCSPDERRCRFKSFCCSASMGKENPQKAAYSAATAAALGFLAVHNMDKVSLYLMKENVAENPFGTIIGKNSFFQKP